MNENLRFWDQLSKTDPDHTKPFNRPGGFRGTAIKPIWTIRRMTEVFGPVGIGWGTEKPDFQLVNVGEEVAVYCTLCCWYSEGDARHFVFGMGGDKVATKRGDGKLQVDDEAYKKAFTDALGNALKHIGASADVHMGLFEDSKYVSATRKEFDAISTAPSSVPMTREPSSLGPDLEAFAEAAPGPKSDLAEMAYKKADLGTEEFREWWRTLSDRGKQMLAGIITQLKARAKAADDKILFRIDVVKVNGKPNWEATTKALVAEVLGFKTEEECRNFEKINAATIKMLRDNDHNQYEAYLMNSEAHIDALLDREETA